MFTELLGFVVRDERGREARLHDLCVALLEDDYPPVTHLLIQQDQRSLHLEWEFVSLDVARSRIDVRDLEDAKEIKDDKDVLLGRDVMDALILDLLGRRTTRANDLLLEEDGSSLRLQAADVSLKAMVRRLTRGRFRRVDRGAMFDWKYVEFLRGDPAAVDNGEGYRLRINRLPAAEIARLADLVPYLHAAELVKLLPNEKAASVLEVMSIERQQQVIEELPEDEAIELISLMSPDLATDLLGRLDLSMMKRYVSRLPEGFRDRVIDLLRYPEDTVGGAMVNRVISMPADTDRARVNDEIRRRLSEADFSSRIYVVDNEEDMKLLGSISLQDLLTMDEDRTLENVMDPYAEPLDPYGPARDAAYRILDSGFSALPVVREGRLIGAMTAGAAIKQIVEPTSELRALRVFS